MDRIDIQIEANKVNYDSMASGEEAEYSNAISERVLEAKHRQEERNSDYGFIYNCDIPASYIEAICHRDSKAKSMLNYAFTKMGGLSARAYHRILKVSRTIADIDGHTLISEKHVAEAINYRTLDRKYWL